MANYWRRLLMVAAASGMVVFAVAAMVLPGPGGAEASDTYTIEITASGFNPALCVVHRPDQVKFKNVDTKPHTVAFQVVGGIPVVPDSPEIAPLDTWAGIILDANTKLSYFDKGNPAVTGVIKNTDTGAAACSPLPPTPTPSPTPVRTPTPAFPPRCFGYAGCAVAPGLSRDED